MGNRKVVLKKKKLEASLLVWVLGLKNKIPSGISRTLLQRCFQMKAIKTQNHPTIEELDLSQWEHHGIAHRRDRYGFDELDIPLSFLMIHQFWHSIASSYIVNVLGGSTSHISFMNDPNKNSYQSGREITTESTLSVWRQCAHVKSTSNLFVPYVILPDWNLPMQNLT